MTLFACIIRARERKLLDDVKEFERRHGPALQMWDEETQTEESAPRSLKSWLWLLTLMLSDSMIVDRHVQQQKSSACSGSGVDAGVQTLELELLIPKVLGVSVATCHICRISATTTN